ncbi:MAG: PKD domain-containing protein [Candidatus Competibacteraceae bacterium]|nr:PKD domain-containing protein [Candidatus Competibacteraceae bacterium]
MFTHFCSTGLNPIPRLLGWLSLFLFCFTSNVFAGQVTLAWDASSGPDVGGYKIVYGQASGAYTSEVDVGNQTSATVANLDDSKTYYFAARAYNTDKTVESANSNEVSRPASVATPPPPSIALPTSWIDMDIGNVGQVGSASYANGAFTVNGSGADIWNNADAFHFTYQSLNGDGAIVARVASITNTNSWAKAGVMIRESLDADARHAMAVVTSGNGVAFQRRTTPGGTSYHTVGAAVGAPYWVKLTRTGNTFTAHQSVDGSSWAQVGSATISMATSVYIGLALTSHNNSVLNTSVLDNVNVQAGNTSPTTVQYTFDSQPSGLNLTYDGASRATPFTVDAVAGSQHSIGAPASQSNYNFNSWSDGGAATHTITIGASPQTLTANYVVATPAPTADISADHTSGPAPLTVKFTDKSTNATGWSWNFGDDTDTSSDQHPSHTYTKAGTYTVTLTASNTTGSNVQTKTGYIKVTEPAPVANFSVSSTTGTTATVFNFFDSSTGTATSWSWNFQHDTDSSVSFTRADQNPMVTFPKAGIYTVTLTVNPGGSTSVPKQVSVTEAPPLADFGVNLTDGTISTPFKFTNNSKGTVETWSWKFVNSTDSTATIDTSDVQNPEKIFSKPGTYTVSLTVTGPGGSDTATKTNYISVSNSLLSQDIGSVGLEGSASFTNGTYTLQGSGDDIWNTSDSFHFTYQRLDGDCTIVARVASITNTDSWAKAGVMIRESLNANSRHAMVVVTPGNGVAFQRRSKTGGSSYHTAGAAAKAPYWVKLTRSGNYFYAYQSQDGVNWTRIGRRITINMATSVYVGLAVTSHDNRLLNTATFDNLSIQ